LRKAKDVIGLPVITVDTGKQVGTVKELKIGPDWKLKAVVLETRSWFAPGRSVAAENIVGLGEDAVTIPGEETVRPQDGDPEARPLADGAGKLFGLPVMTAGGERIGLIEDVYFQPEVGIPLIGFELSEGFLSDLQEGRKTFPIPEDAILGEDAVVIPSSCPQHGGDLFVSHDRV
jgi:uncharacterized protein YrrD